MDAAASLQVLQRATNSVGEVDGLTFGPRWYAPVMAMCPLGFSVFGASDPAGWAKAALFFLGVIVAPAVVSLHEYRHRGARPKLSDRSLLALVWMIPTFILLQVAWEIAITTIGSDNFFPQWTIVGWVLSTLVLLGVRAGVNRVRTARPSIL